MDATDVMTSPVVTAGPDATVLEIVQSMLENRIGAVSILDQAGELVGLVSEGDLMRRSELGGRPAHWSITAHLNIVVKNGVVHFWGLINSQSQREALKVAAENIGGMEDVVDHTINAATLTRSD